jgi:nitroreductase
MDLIEAIQNRRSVRKYTKKPVKRKDLLKMLNAARMAPSGGNSQPWQFIVLHNKKKKAKMVNIIRKKINDLPKMLNGCFANSEVESYFFANRFKMWSLFFSEAPTTIAVLVKFIDRPCVKYFTRRGLNLFEANKYIGFVEIQSVAAAIENLLLAAHSLGYGACWMNIPFIAKDELKKILRVRSPWDLIAMVPVGIPDPTYLPPKLKRKKIKEIVKFL